MADSALVPLRLFQERCEVIMTLIINVIIILILIF